MKIAARVTRIQPSLTLAVSAVIEAVRRIRSARARRRGAPTEPPAAPENPHDCEASGRTA